MSSAPNYAENQEKDWIGSRMYLKKKLLPYNIVLVSAIQQNESSLFIHISSLFGISFPFSSPQNTEKSSLCYICWTRKMIRWTYLQSRNTDTDIEKSMDTKDLDIIRGVMKSWCHTDRAPLVQTALWNVAVVGWRGLSITSQPRMLTGGREFSEGRGLCMLKCQQEGLCSCTRRGVREGEDSAEGTWFARVISESETRSWPHPGVEQKTQARSLVMSS